MTTPAENIDDIFTRNPYMGHPSLSELEASVLWEYAKLTANVKQATNRTRLLTSEPDTQMLSRLRILEKKMGLVLTLFKASVWGVINEQPIAETSYELPPDSESRDDQDNTGETTIKYT
ncbi:DASH complex subunit Dad3-domain-containing protein [Flagelloscypha sp. PMI_526]|nr:DASH complex subunit Dad3-domain-containing protein [Flagelloscypha sp. PMI_526]